MTKATLLIVSSLAMAAALLAMACGGSPDGEEPDRRSRTERQERQRDTPEPVATAIPGDTPSGLSSLLGRDREDTPEPAAAAVPGETPSGLSSLLGRDGGAEPERADLSFTSVSAGRDHTCGVTTTGDALCWGEDYDGQATPPAGVSFRLRQRGPGPHLRGDHLR